MKYALVLTLSFISLNGHALPFKEAKEIVEKRNSDKNPDNDVRTVEAFIKMLPNDYREIFSMMTDSKSLQTSDEENPRILMYGKDRRTVYTFNSPHATSGGDAIELMDTVSKNGKTIFEFREINFKDGKVTYSQANPQKCIRCHTHNTNDVQFMRPNWQPYSRWDGALGSNDDILGLSFGRGNYELDLYRKMQQEFPNKERYRLLNLETFNKDDGKVTILFGHANMTLTSVLTQLNYERIITRLKTSSFYEYYKYAIFGASACRMFDDGKDDDLEKFKNMFFPQEIKEKHDQRYTKAMRYDWLDESYRVKGTDLVMPLINYVLGPLGENTFYWSMNFKPRHLLPDPRFQTPTDSRSNFLGVFLNEDKELLELSGNRIIPQDVHGQMTIKSSQIHTEVCEKFAQKSIEKLNELVESGKLDSYYGNRAISLLPKNIQSCVGCHSVGEGFAPEIPFADVGKFRNALDKKWRDYDKTLLEMIQYKVSTKQMPKGIDITDQQREEILRYFENLL
ncbi:hypothetical protein M899_3333 [Bacteriovorax sp. BSW11_IV]|uniref:hypothetical protein n=1 Tax=Bacteriovorax sp. BSW11_IV TaxID=1353529 RepID=UPI00038A0296|nr:hypothetical protein [Bacteriovorax sp. BSW11_IV]EQC48782.1 hypothetical protein M899_3333 [Bacteriovorax sp. BSW11_IV]